MRLQTAFYAAALTGTAAVFLSACSGAQHGGSVGLPPTAAAAKQAPPNVLRARRVGLAGAGRTVYVAEASKNDVLAFGYGHHAFTEIGAVPGASGGYGLWVDRQKDVYIGDNGAVHGSIAEYNELGNHVFTYSSGIGAVQAVTTDRFGNVFEADLDNSVREFPSGVNTAIATCTPPDAAEGAWGVAVDRQGDVFVDYADVSASGNLIEYPHGLIASGCSGTQLLGQGAFSGPGGIALDPQNNLVICSLGDSVYIVAPPYLPSSNVSQLGSGYNQPIDVTITRGGSQAYVTDIGFGFTRLMTYPGGTTLATLSKPTYAPTAAVDTSNYVP